MVTSKPLSLAFTLACLVFSTAIFTECQANQQLISQQPISQQQATEAKSLIELLSHGK